MAASAPTKNKDILSAPMTAEQQAVKPNLEQPSHET